MRNSSGRTRRIAAVVGVVVTLVGSTLLAVGSPAVAGTPPITDPPNDRIVIEVVTVNGSGCRTGTAAVAVAPDNTAFTVTYSDYLAQVGVGSRATDFRKNCQVNVLVHVPSGFTYAIARADYRGFASLAPGANATVRGHYYFQGHPATDIRAHRFTGEFQDSWQVSDQTDIAALVYHPCGERRLFNINTDLVVNRGTSDIKKTTSFITLDSTDGSIETVYHFHWGRCPR